jgi:hypothetical protein
MKRRHADPNYVAILKWREAEARTLFALGQDVKQKVLPLLELVPPDAQKVATLRGRAEYIESEIARIAGTRGKAPFLLDASWIEGDTGIHPLQIAWYRAKSLRLHMIPVVSTRQQGYPLAAARNAHREMKHGVCLRECADTFQSPTFSDCLRRTIAEIDAKPADVDLVLDLGFVVEDPFAMRSIVAAIERMRDLEALRSFTLAGSSMPKNLSHLAERTVHRIARAEWFLWKEVCDSLSKGTRAPGFGDFGIVHPTMTRGGRLGVATVRYTVDNEYVVVRGRQLEGNGYGEYVHVARDLLRLNEYCGAHFSRGDEFVRECAAGTCDPGDQGRWIEVGLSHHLTFVVRQLAARSARDVRGPASSG